MSEALVELKSQIKIGVGIELTYEGLLMLIRDRFPNLVDWDNIAAMPSVEVSPNTQRIGLYHLWLTDEDLPAEAMVGRDLRRIAQGAPAPVIVITTERLRTRDGDPRCPYFYPWSIPRPSRDYAGHYQIEQCELPDGHDSEHGPYDG